MKYDVIVVGAGFAGATLARKFADENKKVLVIDKRNHIGGNMYEETRKNKVRVHLYGPHIFHTNDKEVFEFLQKYSDFFFYEHRVVGYVDGKYIPIPFNLKSLEILYDSKSAKDIKEKLLKKYNFGDRISIFDLINSDDDQIKKFGEFVFDRIFVHYTAKQWNTSIDNVDTSVINRVPVVLGYDDRYFHDKYQFMPKEGFNKVFENMLDDKNITVKTKTNAKDILSFDTTNNIIYYKGKVFNGIVIYTGPIDELLDYKFGPLPYRSLKLKFEDKEYNYYQPSSVINYTISEKYTRITEFKYLSNQVVKNNTTILKEYPLTYDYKNPKNIPYYVIANEKNLKLYDKYVNEIKGIEKLYLCGRLAEYKYYNMDQIIRKALDLYEEIK